MITRWNVRVALIDINNRIYLQKEISVIAKSKSEALGKAKGGVGGQKQRLSQQKTSSLMKARN